MWSSPAVRRGIGAACAEAFAGQGAGVSLIGRTEASLQETRKRLGLSGGIACADVADDNAIDAAGMLRTDTAPSRYWSTMPVRPKAPRSRRRAAISGTG